jgi:hypothetical protein
MNGRGSVYASYLFLSLLFSCSAYAADPGILTRIMQTIRPVWFGFGPRSSLSSRLRQEMTEEAYMKRMEKLTGLKVNPDTITQQTDGKVVEAPPTPEFVVEAVKPKIETRKSDTVGMVVSPGAEKQFLQPGQRQPYGNPDDPNYVSNGSFYKDGKGGIGYQTGVGNNTTVSVGTDLGSIIRFAKDAGEVLFGGQEKSSQKVEKPNVAEIPTTPVVKAKKSAFTIKCESQTKEQLIAEKAQLESRNKSIVEDQTRFAKAAQSPRKSEAARDNDSRLYEKSNLEKRHVDHEISIINAELRKRSLNDQVITTGATTAVMITQTASTGPTQTTEMVPVITSPIQPQPSSSVPSKTSESTPALTGQILKEMVEMHNAVDDRTDIEALNKLLYEPAYKATPESMSTVEVPKSLSIPTPIQTSNPSSQPQPSAFSQAKDGATFFAKNVDPNGAMQVAQTGALVSDFLKDDGAADLLLGKPAKYALGSCIAAVGIPSAIGVVCPPCAPFMAPAISAGATYCSGALTFAGGSAVMENAAHLAGHETSITQTRRKVFEQAKASLNKPEYELTDDQYFKGLGQIPTSQLEKMKGESDSWIWKAANYSPSSIDRYQAEHEQRFSKLIGEELEIRTMQPANEISDEENINRLKVLNIEEVIATKQKQENFVKTGAGSKSRMDKYLASRAEHYLTHTERELNLREGLINKTTAIIPHEKAHVGCGNAEPLPPMPPLVTPMIPQEKQKPGCERPPVEILKPLINVPPLEADHWGNYIHTQAKPSDKDKAGEKEKEKRYDGPTYGRTEDWIKNNPLGKEFERTDRGMQGKRAFRLKNKIPALTGISEGEYVVVDAAHKDHLEVYNKHGEWTHVANFDGTKNIEKTRQGEREPRQKLKNL